MAFALKQGNGRVKVAGLKPEALVAVLVFYDLVGHTATGLTITSITDGVHKTGSKHFEGMAFDVRTKDMDGTFVTWLAARAREILGPDYDIVLEPTHLHVEFDPKE